MSNENNHFPSPTINNKPTMSKVNEIRELLAIKQCDITEAHNFIKGFDACMDLRIGEKFAEWKDRFTRVEWVSGQPIYYNTHEPNTTFIPMPLPELYDYYIENVLSL